MTTRKLTCTGSSKKERRIYDFSFYFIFHTIFIKYVFFSCFYCINTQGREEKNNTFFPLLLRHQAKNIASENRSNVLLARRQKYKYTAEYFCFVEWKKELNEISAVIKKKLEWRQKTFALASVLSRFVGSVSTQTGNTGFSVAFLHVKTVVHCARWGWKCFVLSALSDENTFCHVIPQCFMTLNKFLREFWCWSHLLKSKLKHNSIVMMTIVCYCFASCFVHATWLFGCSSHHSLSLAGSAHRRDDS